MAYFVKQLLYVHDYVNFTAVASYVKKNIHFYTIFPVFCQIKYLTNQKHLLTSVIWINKPNAG